MIVTAPAPLVGIRPTATAAFVEARSIYEDLAHAPFDVWSTHRVRMEQAAASEKLLSGAEALESIPSPPSWDQRTVDEFNSAKEAIRKHDGLATNAREDILKAFANGIPGDPGSVTSPTRSKEESWRSAFANAAESARAGVAWLEVLERAS